MKRFLIMLLCVACIALCACAKEEQPALVDEPVVPEVPAIAETEAAPDEPASVDEGDDAIDGLWELLIGFWRWVDEAGIPSNEYFIYFGYDEAEKPIYYAVYGYEGGETEYATDCTVVDDFNYSVTYHVPENTYEEGLFDMHDAYYKTGNYDLSDYAAGRIYVTADDGTESVWEYAGTTFTEAAGEEQMLEPIL